MSHECSICNRPAPASEAVIEVDSAAAMETQWNKESHEFRAHREHVESGGGLRVTTLGSEPDWPVSKWEYNHYSCSEAADEVRGHELGYVFEAGRMLDAAEALGWTLHLQGKTWLESTNWKEFMEDLGFPRDS